MNINLLSGIFEFPFMQRAFIAGIILAALLSLLGVFVVLKKMAFFADGIAHASLAGVAAGIIFSSDPLLWALSAAVLFSIVIFFLEQKQSLSADTSIGIIFSFGMALGVFLISLKPGYQSELVSFLFGNILAIRRADIGLIGILSGLIILYVIKNLRSLTLLCLDKESAYLAGVKSDRMLLILNIILAVAVVLGIRIMGVILVSALLVIPVATAKIFSKSFIALLIMSIFFGEAAVISGLIISFSKDIPAGPAIVLSGTLLFASISLVFNILAGRRRVKE